MTTCPKCPQCGREATRAIFLPSLFESQFVVPVCDKHDVLGDGDDFGLQAMAANPRPFLEAFDRQQIEGHEALREWLLERARAAANCRR